MPVPDLLATCWTTAGDAAPYPGRMTSPRDLVARIEAASAAGFVGFGLLDTDLEVFLRTGSYAGLRQILNDNGITTLELEFLTNWWTTDSRRPESDRLRDFLFMSAAELGARDVKIAPDITGEPVNPQQFADEFAAVCDAAAAVGTLAVLEFMPFSNVSDIHVGVATLERAGRPPAGGLIADLWHLERAGTNPEDLRTIGIWPIKAVELDDADAEVVGDMYEDTVERRRLCGEGDFRVVEWISVLHEIGWTGPWGIEILSAEFRVRDLQESTTDAFNTAVTQFELAGVI